MFINFYQIIKKDFRTITYLLTQEPRDQSIYLKAILLCILRTVKLLRTENPNTSYSESGHIQNHFYHRFFSVHAVGRRQGMLTVSHTLIFTQSAGDPTSTISVTSLQHGNLHWSANRRKQQSCSFEHV